MVRFLLIVLVIAADDIYSAARDSSYAVWYFARWKAHLTRRACNLAWYRCQEKIILEWRRLRRSA
jgi:hypothetical protein